MSEIVFIFGAGASTEAGAPVMRGFLDAAREVYWKLQVAERESFDEVFEGINQLQLAHSKAELDIQNVESVFAAFELAGVIESLGHLDLERILRLPDAMKVLITKTLEWRTTLNLARAGEGEAPRIVLPAPYAKLMKRIDHLTQGAQLRQTVSIITFNYDLLLDIALSQARLNFNYCLEGEDRNTQHIPLLKLHGSINWATCDECQRVVAKDIQRLRPTPFQEKIRFNTGSQIVDGKFEHCNQIAGGPFLVPPTWSKVEHHKQISHVWRAAAHELSEAHTIVLIGYSLPPTDEFFRYLYALGTIGKPLRHFLVCDPDSDAHGRFENLQGPGARDRYVGVKKGFAEGLDDIFDLALGGKHLT